MSCEHCGLPDTLVEIDTDEEFALCRACLHALARPGHRDPRPIEDVHLP